MISKVFCYRNLMRKGIVWSVRDVKSGLVIDRVSSVILKNVHLKVSQAGRARVLASKRKNVHAGIQGQRMNRAPKGVWVQAQYNPYKSDSFVLTDSGRAIGTAMYARLTQTGLWVMLKEFQA